MRHAWHPDGLAGLRRPGAEGRGVRPGEDLCIQVVGLEDLIRLKRAAGRCKDVDDADALEEIRELRTEDQGDPT